MNRRQEAIIVRRAVFADRPFVLSLASRFAETRAPWRTEDEVTSGTARMLAAAFDEPRECDVLFIAETAGRSPVAFALGIEERDFFTGAPHAHLSEIAAVPGGTGAGTVLIAAIEAWARGRGSRYLSLNVMRNNAGAFDLYERLGFEIEYRHMTKLL